MGLGNLNGRIGESIMSDYDAFMEQMEAQRKNLLTTIESARHLIDEPSLVDIATHVIYLLTDEVADAYESRVTEMEEIAIQQHPAVPVSEEHQSLSDTVSPFAKPYR